MTDVLFDMARIFIRGSRFSPTGIDRVVVAYAKWLLSDPAIELQPVVTFGGRLFGVPRAMLERTIRHNEAFARRRHDDDTPTPSWEELRRALGSSDVPSAPMRARPMSSQLPARARWHAAIAGRALLHLRPLTPRAGALYINVSHTGLDQPDVLQRLHNAKVTPVVLVHDLIPINYPEYCSPSAEARHLRRMDEITRAAGLIVTNSATTADEVRAFTEARGRRPPPLVVAPLGIEADFAPEPVAWTAARPYFVCVGTLEARKNVAFLLSLWRQLADRLGDDAPRLVLVGRRGWENESVIDHLERSKAALQLVHEVSDLRDAELAQLIAGAAALISPSIAEGFDLPVVEALAVGTPVIASDIAVHRELAGQAATLVDPADGPHWLTAIEDAMRRPARGPAYDAPRWEAHFTRVGEAIKRLPGSA